MCKLTRLSLLATKRDDHIVQEKLMPSICILNKRCATYLALKLGLKGLRGVKSLTRIIGLTGTEALTNLHHVMHLLQAC